MLEYSFTQWILFLYIYCFLGWCFESAYVSLKEKRFVNRGFMKGPFLPIYGFGALSILMTSLPCKDAPVLVYFLGALSATLLEFITGICMEVLFKVRYWDYTEKKIQFKGYICLGSSLTWGAFSLALVYGLHRPIEYLVLQIPKNLEMYISFFMSIILAADFATSFKTALDIKQVISRIEGIIDLHAVSHLRMLRRNPYAVSKKYSRLLEEYKLKMEAVEEQLRKKRHEEKKSKRTE